MIDHEKTIDALEHCVNDVCKGCPYQQKSRLLFGTISCDDVIKGNTVRVSISLINRVLTLLKAQSEIVHCKDCEEFATDLNGNTFCLRYDSYFGLQDPNDFCSHGKRKQEAEHEH